MPSAPQLKPSGQPVVPVHAIVQSSNELWLQPASTIASAMIPLKRAEDVHSSAIEPASICSLLLT